MQGPEPSDRKAQSLQRRLGRFLVVLGAALGAQLGSTLVLGILGMAFVPFVAGEGQTSGTAVLFPVTALASASVSLARYHTGEETGALSSVIEICLWLTPLMLGLLATQSLIQRLGITGLAGTTAVFAALGAGLGGAVFSLSHSVLLSASDGGLPVLAGLVTGVALNGALAGAIQWFILRPDRQGRKGDAERPD